MSDERDQLRLKLQQAELKTQQAELITQQAALKTQQAEAVAARAVAGAKKALQQNEQQHAAGPRKLTLLQVVDKPAQPFVYAWPPSTSTIMPSQHLRHVPDQVLPWLGVTEQACAFRERLPATPAVYGCYMPTIMQPNNEGTALWLLDNTFFSVANQLGNEPGLAAIKFNEFPEGFKLAVAPDRVWTCNGKVIGVAEGKQPGSRPALPGDKLVEGYNPNMPLTRVTTQLQRVCGQLHHNGLKYGVLYTDGCFWFLRYGADSARGTLYVLEGIMVSGTQPTVLLMLLFVGDLAQQHASHSMPSISCRDSLPLVLPFLGSVHSLTIRESSPESLPHQLCMGHLLGRGSTGSVRLGRTGNVDLAVKLFEEGVDRSSACQRLQQELDLYQGLLHPLQGICVPRLMASGTVEGPSDTRLPFFALELLPVSLADVAARLCASEYERVLEALNSIHQQGMLHGDIEPRHVVYSSWNSFANPKWIDFSNASQA